MRLPRVVGSMVLVFISCVTATAQDNRAAARDLVKKWQDAIVNVRVVVKTRMSMGGREVQSSDDTIEVVGTVVDPGGLTVVSLSSDSRFHCLSFVLICSSRSRA